MPSAAAFDEGFDVSPHTPAIHCRPKAEIGLQMYLGRKSTASAAERLIILPLLRLLPRHGHAPQWSRTSERDARSRSSRPAHRRKLRMYRSGALPGMEGECSSIGRLTKAPMIGPTSGIDARNRGEDQRNGMIYFECSENASSRDSYDIAKFEFSSLEISACDTHQTLIMGQLLSPMLRLQEDGA
jgi:hypothetical protein